jgi:hypothetical protein
VAGKKFAKSVEGAESAERTQLIAFIQAHKAGSPTQPDVYWVYLRPREIARRYFEKYAIAVSHGVIKRILRELGYGFRKQSKQIPTGSYARRNDQFNIICDIVLLVSLKTPIISIDCKKKEQLGNLYRAGKSCCTKALAAHDHDYSHLGQGKVVPHGIYDLYTNTGYISIGASHETGDFITDNLLWWWTNYGIHQYPDAKQILVLCDAGGGNSYRHHVFKYHLLNLAREIGINILICHYPPYASKWNPIEHRLFCHAHQAIQGCPFTDYETVRQLFAATATDKGLAVVVRLNLKQYFTKQKITKNDVDFTRIRTHFAIPELNYIILF